MYKEPLPLPSSLTTWYILRLRGDARNIWGELFFVYYVGLDFVCRAIGTQIGLWRSASSTLGGSIAKCSRGRPVYVCGMACRVSAFHELLFSSSNVTDMWSDNIEIEITSSSVVTAPLWMRGCGMNSTFRDSSFEFKSVLGLSQRKLQPASGHQRITTVPFWSGLLQERSSHSDPSICIAS